MSSKMSFDLEKSPLDSGRSIYGGGELQHLIVRRTYLCVCVGGGGAMGGGHLGFTPQSKPR